MRRPTAYLDMSTLCDAFKAAQRTAGESSNEYEELPGIIETLSQSGTLFVSPTHVRHPT